MTHFMPGGESDDLAQHARLGVVYALRAWDPCRRVPFSSLAWLCAVRETRRAANAARAGKHQPLNGARALHPIAGEDAYALEDSLEATGRPDADPVAKTLGREQLHEILMRAHALTDLERQALVLYANDHSHYPAVPEPLRAVAAPAGSAPRAAVRMISATRIGALRGRAGGRRDGRAGSRRRCRR